MHVVVVAQAGVAGEARGGALVAAIHGDKVDVDVDDEVALGCPLVELHGLAVWCLAQHDHAVGVLCVMVVQESLGGECVIDAVAHGVAEFVLGHAPVQGEGCDQVDVIDAGLGGDVEHGLDDPLADVRPTHWW